MIKKLQQRFIRIAVISLTVAMVLVVGIVNVANWISVRNELSSTLNLLAENETEGEERAEKEGERTAPPGQEGENAPFRRPSRHFRNMMAESNWFSALVSETGEVERVMLARIKNLEEDTARELIGQITASGRTEGFHQDYLYRIMERRNGRREVMVLNCETRLATVRKLVLISAVACAGGILLAWLLVTLASRKAVAPVIRNMEQQKQFITNASHELKTPLTVISTNMELLQMETEGNPWVRSTQKQTAMMRKLVDELVYLSRMEEERPTLELETLDPGRLLEETAEIRAVCTAGTTGKTGVEMEALTGVACALLTIYDMCKAADKTMEIGTVRLIRKSGGKSGDFANPKAAKEGRETE